jgi:hypothetical protein
MRRMIPLALLALTVTGGVAFADRHGGRHDDRRSGGVVVRDNRGPVVVRDHRGPGYDRGRPGRRVVVRNRVYVNNGRYVFGGGVSRVYVRPVIRAHYYDVRVRPVVLVENMEPVPGYVWIRGGWNWNGYEWAWVSGHYEPDMRYSNYYDDGTYDVTPGVNISGGVTVRGGF